ncbi:phytanoyl-CoA dioxygenase family protein [Hahella ganghwensis]|uniref:phytanoyl-CoA dioxygenase family protein n=1 Tax=Hahella ganghwensis TaxID=286420 RepID=UPI0003820244|nr:phytanoyl-CoA dioxygenase family protein [Hahella ganghwensis]
MTTNTYQPSDNPIASAIEATSLSELPEPAIVRHTQPLIENPPDAGFAKPHVDALASILGDITGISAHDDLGNSLGMNLKSGVALSPVQAAKCLTELMRTHSFIHAVARAVKDLLERKGQVEIVYAGTGPYGLLLLPLLACLKDSRIRATLIDIHEENVQAVRAVVSTLGIGPNIRSIELEDATCWIPPSGRKFDIILSETMNWMLNNEPQVMIFSHLVQYLRDEHSTLIPQRVVMDACLYNPVESNQFKTGKRAVPPEETKLALIGSLDRDAAIAIANGNRTLLNARIVIPETLPTGQTSLKFRTEIQIYQDLWLRDGQCSLNTPMCFDETKFLAGDRIALTYVFGECIGVTPGYDIRFPVRKKRVEEPVSDLEVGQLGIRQLKRMWHRLRLQRDGRLKPGNNDHDWNKDLMLLDLLHLGLEQSIQYIFQEARTFSQFEQWVLEKNGGEISPGRVKEINAAISGNGPGNRARSSSARWKRRCLSEGQYKFWQDNGYLVIEDVLEQEHCRKSVEVIYDYLEKSPDDPKSWYQAHPSQQNVMVQLFQNPVLEANRQSRKAQQVFFDLWQTDRLRYSADRVGFNPPESDAYRFSGTRLHWDLNFSQPLRFQTQGLFYLADVTENQGAFKCVPGFHHRLAEWLQELPPGTDPNQQDLSFLPVKHVAAPAGSLIVWHWFLPHGGSPNTADSPRIVQYFNMLPLDDRGVS